MDYILFDGSLLHHPLNDLIRNYGATREQVAAHVAMLLGCLKHGRATVFYLSTGDVAGQLRLARRNRGQTPPNPKTIAFWERRKELDRYVLEHAVPDCLVLDPSRIGYEAALDRVIAALLGSV